MKFIIEGDAREIGEAPPPVKLATAALESLPLGRLWTLERVSAAAGLSKSQFTVYATKYFNERRAKTGARFLYGSKKTIQLWRREQAKQASKLP